MQMAVVVSSWQHLSQIGQAFLALGDAAGLHVNVSKTVCVPVCPLPDTNIRFILTTVARDGMKLKVLDGLARYLVFLVSP